MDKIKEKIEVYREYLNIYLEILLRTDFREIRVYEPFAGNGKEKGYGENEGFYEGSVNVAIPLIEKKISGQEHHGKKIRYFVNDIDPQKYEELKKNFATDAKGWLNVSNRAAKEFIAEHTKDMGTYVASLWFIDPYGYTQVDKDDFAKIYKKKSSDIIIFIPTQFITRFIGGDPEKEPEAPVKRFLDMWGISVKEAKENQDVDKFAKLLTTKIRNLNEGLYALPYTLSFDNTKNNYSLIFISKHRLGAEKFLESTRKIYIKKGSDLFNPKDPVELKPEEILAWMEEKSMNNIELSDKGVHNGLLATDLKALLTVLEKDNKIVRKHFDGTEGKPRGYYLRPDKKNKYPRVIFSIKNQND